MNFFKTKDHPTKREKKKHILLNGIMDRKIRQSHKHPHKTYTPAYIHSYTYKNTKIYANLCCLDTLIDTLKKGNIIGLDAVI